MLLHKLHHAAVSASAKAPTTDSHERRTHVQRQHAPMKLHAGLAVSPYRMLWSHKVESRRTPPATSDESPGPCH